MNRADRFTKNLSVFSSAEPAFPSPPLSSSLPSPTTSSSKDLLDDGLSWSQVKQLQLLHGPNDVTDNALSPPPFPSHQQYQYNGQCGFIWKLYNYFLHFVYRVSSFIDNHQFPFHKVKEQLFNPLIGLLGGATLLSLLLGQVENASSIGLAIILVVAVATWQEWRTERSLAALRNLAPPLCRVKREGKWWTVGGQSLVPGDLVKLRMGDRIPADLLLLKGVELQVDESMLTGETDAVFKRELGNNNVDGDQSNATSQIRPKVIDSGPVNVEQAMSMDLKDDSNCSSKPIAHNYLQPPPSSLTVNDHQCILFMGTLVKQGYGWGRVVAIGKETKFGHLYSLMREEAKEPSSPLQVQLDKLGYQLSIYSLLVIGMMVIVGVLKGQNWLSIFTVAISLAVAAIPEGLPIVATITLAWGAWKLARRNVIIRKLTAVEALGSVDILCLDKTGTITFNQLTVEQVWLANEGNEEDCGKDDGFDVNATSKKIGNRANNSTNNQTINGTGNPIINGTDSLTINATGNQTINSTSSEKLVQQTLKYLRYCNNAQWDDQMSTWYGNAIDVALMKHVHEATVDDNEEYLTSFKRVDEVTFTSSRKYMLVRGREIDSNSTNDDDDEGGKSKPIISIVKGAPELILPWIGNQQEGLHKSNQGTTLRPLITRQQSSQHNHSQHQPYNSQHQHYLQRVLEMYSQGLRVIVLAMGIGINPQQWKLMAIIGLGDAIRPEVSTTLQQIKSAGVHCIMITGDARETALAVAHQINFCSMDDGIWEGEELVKHISSISQTNKSQSALLQSLAIIYRATPHHKLELVKALQAHGHVVAMTGDGVNDAPALKQADIGISLGSGTDVAKEAAQIILLDDRLANLVMGIEEGKGIFSNIRHFLRFQLGISLGALFLVVLSMTLGGKDAKLPLNAMQILLINIIMDGPPAQGLGVESVDRQVLRRPPRPRNLALLSAPLLARTVGTAIGMAGAVYWWGRGDLTRTFVLFVLFSLTNALACRSNYRSLASLPSNHYLTVTLIISLVITVLVVQVKNWGTTFGTRPLLGWEWMELGGIALSLLLIDELIKAIIVRPRLRRNVSCFISNTSTPSEEQPLRSKVGLVQMV